jgi:hypothetical protein
VRRPDGPFRNRERQLAQIAAHIDAAQSDSEYLKVLEVVGLGGAGKSRLLKQVRTTTHRGRGHLVSISLEEEGSTTETGPLIEIREQLEMECPLFETALLAFGRASGQRFAVEEAPSLSGSAVVKVLEMANSMGGFLPLLPLGFAIEMFTRLKRAGVKLTRYSPEQFEEIDSFGNESGEIRKRLPHWLGVDLKQASARPRHFVAIYDSYDRQSQRTKQAKAEWLREFIGTLDHGVHLVSTRDELLWDPKDWGDVVETVRVEELPEAEARQMIEAEFGEVPPAHRHRLLEASGRLPFFLQAVIEVYAKARTRDDFDPAQLPSSPEGAVAHLLKHLEPDEQELALTLATVQVFDEELYGELLRRLNLDPSLLRFERFLDWFFVEEISVDGSSGALYKTHDLLTGYVRGAEEHETTRRRCLEAATDALLLRCGDGARRNTNSALLILRALIAGWESLEGMPKRAVENLIDAVYLLYDAGYWNALGLIVSDADRSSLRAISAASAFVAALTARRIDGIPIGIEKFEALASRAGDLGRHRHSSELELAYLREIAGDYEGAREKFRQLATAATGFDPADRTERRAQMYHADMLIMDGEFPQAARRFQKTYERLGAGAAVDSGEMVRLRAHAYRFSFMLERAAEMYTDVLAATTEAPALEAKLHSNLAEACCWYDPTRALDEAEISTDRNQSLGNEIEIAKCEAARCLALTKLGRLDEGLSSAEDARRRAERFGYPAGEAFALQAKAVAAGLEGEVSLAAEAVMDLERKVDELGTYSHLLVAPRWVLEEREEFERLVAAAKWFEPDALEERLKRYLTPVADRGRNLD